jgi:7-cyano-7-deazaguanine synthase in queuosine biosynthesis
MDDLLRDPRWTDVFLPSLAHALYISRKPFKHFKTKAPEFLQVVQEIFNLSYLEIDLHLRSKDELVQKVRAMCHNHMIHPTLTKSCDCHSGMLTHECQESKACVGHSRRRDGILQGAGIC